MRKEKGTFQRNEYVEHPKNTSYDIPTYKEFFFFITAVVPL